MPDLESPAAAAGAARPRWGAALVWAALLSLLALVGFGLVRVQQGPVAAGARAPDFELRTFDGQTFVTRALRGQVVVDLAIGEAWPGVAMTPQTIMLWLSACKPLTAVAVAQLWERGRLKLDDPVIKHIPEFAPREQKVATAIQVMGVGDLLTHLSPCCNPVPGDKIIGYITRTRGISVHREDCSNMANIAEKERLIKVDWGRTEQLWPVPLVIEAFDRVGLLRDITSLVADEKVNIAAVNMTNHSDRTASVSLTIETTGIAQLSRLMSKLEGVKGIISVTRHAQEVKLAK